MQRAVFLALITVEAKLRQNPHHRLSGMLYCCSGKPQDRKEGYKRIGLDAESPSTVASFTIVLRDMAVSST
jgi:hypothetical protein